LWIEDGVDANDFVRNVEERSSALGLVDVKFNRPYPQSSEADRANVPADKFANCATEGIWEGNCAAYFKGASGEQLEIYAIEGAFKQNIGRAFCERGGGNRAFLGPQCEDRSYCDASKRLHLSQQLHGIFQQGFRSRDLNAAIGFYTEVLGGDLIARPSQGTALMQSDAFQWQIFANETFEAWRFADKHNIPRSEALKRFAVPDISPSGHDRLDLMFILFDNFVVEPLEYTAGMTYGATGYDPVLDHSSSMAYVGTFAASYGVGDATLSEYLDSFQTKLERQGYSSVKAPDAIAGFAQDHPYHGLEYTYGKGPDGEALAFVRLAGQFKELVRDAYKRASTVSTLFPETDAFANGDMASFCKPFQAPDAEL
jgi:catechol 2,3-dioxygenase-like lactoylglutathione lyase family enzyme